MSINLNNLTLKGTEIAVVPKPQEEPSVVKKMEGVYDELSKKIFLFDCSGSMREQLAETDKYLWPEATMEVIRKVARDLLTKTPNPIMAEIEREHAYFPADRFLARHDWGTEPSEIRNDAGLKAAVVAYDLMKYFGVIPDVTRDPNQRPISRTDVVRKLAKREVLKRFDRFPEGKLSVIRFNDYAEVLFESEVVSKHDHGRIQEIREKLEEVFNSKLEGSGCTNYLEALRTGLESCRRFPSKVGLHHFIFVGDGEDGVCAAHIESWIPTLQASGVVLDYIHIGETTPNRGIVNTCIALGGQCVTVSSETEFEDRFVEAATRKLLPPPAPKQ